MVLKVIIWLFWLLHVHAGISLIIRTSRINIKPQTVPASNILMTEQCVVGWTRWLYLWIMESHKSLNALGILLVMLLMAVYLGSKLWQDAEWSSTLMFWCPFTGAHYSKETTRGGGHDLHNFISSGFVTLGRSQVKGNRILYHHLMTLKSFVHIKEGVKKKKHLFLIMLARNSQCWLLALNRAWSETLVFSFCRYIRNSKHTSTV